MTVWLSIAEGYESTCIIAAHSTEAEAKDRAVTCAPSYKPYAEIPAVIRLDLDAAKNYSMNIRGSTWRFIDGSWRLYP